MADSTTQTEPQKDAELDRVVGEEQRVLNRVLKHLATRELRRAGPVDYDDDLIALRDEISEARLEDVPALVAQMERLQQVAARRADVNTGDVDVRSPYFGRIVLQEGERKREVLIGRATYLDSKTGVQIVDWRDAPVSRVYYRYDEGDDYDEEFGGRYVEGEVLTRRSLAINDGSLRRIGATQGTFLCRHDGSWVRLGDSTILKGGQGTAPRPSDYKPVGRLGVAHDGDIREDKFLPEIAALIDGRQFELITKPDSGLVVIQGGAGSGKTTIGLHRLAYLSFQDRKRFRAERMLVVVFNDALARYISHVLPALGVPGVPVITFHDWARKLRTSHLRDLPSLYTDETPDVVVRLKKHPAWLPMIDEHVRRQEQAFEDAVRQAAGGEAAKVLQGWAESSGKALAQRARRLLGWLGQQGDNVAPRARHGIERELRDLLERADVVSIWAELLTDRKTLFEALSRHAPGEFTEGQVGAAFRWCSARCGAAVAEIEDKEERRAQRGSNSQPDDFQLGVDGTDERTSATLDWEDDALLLRIHQRVRGPLKRKQDVLRYEHIFVDEAQDLSPLELSTVLGTTRSQSVTLAGDVAQRLMMDNGFEDWGGVLDQLGKGHVEVEPLQVTYRSTRQIMELANGVLGPLLPEMPGQAMRDGVPVELFRFSHTGDAVGFLAESLRSLLAGEPLASVAVITRSLEQAREYAEGLTRAEVPHVRLIAEQDFPFKAGIDVTDVRQVKGLEFDYVVLVEVTTTSYPETDEARHLLHIAATRAAHQLWITTTDKPSPLLPPELCERGY